MTTMMKNQWPGDGCDHNSHDHNDDDDYQHENGEEGPIVLGVYCQNLQRVELQDFYATSPLL